MMMSETDWRELAVALAAALVASEEIPSEPDPTEREQRPCGCAEASRGAPLLARAETLSRERATKMHRELGRLGLGREAHYELAESVLEREVKSLTTLTDPEALTVLNAARRLANRRASDLEALAVLN